MRADACDRISLTRSTARYREALALARMILEHRAPELHDGTNRVFALLFDMNNLWERYVGWLFRRAAPGHCDVILQEPRGFWRSKPSSARRVRPDLILRHRATGQVLLIADAKWRIPEDSGPADNELKQMFVYNSLFGATRAVLVYPAARAAQQRLEGQFLDRAHLCGTVEIGLFEGSKLRSEVLIEQVRRLLERVG